MHCVGFNLRISTRVDAQSSIRYLVSDAWGRVNAGGSGDFEADCLTVNPLMGPDSLEPFLECVRRYGKGLFVLCRTSNPGAGWLQDRMTGNRFVSDRLADLIATIGGDCRQGAH